MNADDLVLVMQYVEGHNLEKILFGKGTNIVVRINLRVYIVVSWVRLRVSWVAEIATILLTLGDDKTS